MQDDKPTVTLPAVLACQVPLYRALDKDLAVILRGEDGTFSLDLSCVKASASEYVGGNTYGEIRTYLATQGVILPAISTLDFDDFGRAFAVAGRVAVGDRVYDAGAMRWGRVSALATEATHGRLTVTDEDGTFEAYEADLFLPAPGVASFRTGEPACLNHRFSTDAARVRKPYFIPSMDFAVTERETSVQKP